jgi:hypothetical protein
MMTLFACFLPFESLPTIFDMFIMDGWRAVFRIGIQLLRQMEPVLLQKDLIEITVYFRDHVRHQKMENEFELFLEAANVRVNRVLVRFTSLTFVFRSTTRSSTS